MLYRNSASLHFLSTNFSHITIAVYCYRLRYRNNLNQYNSNSRSVVSASLRHHYTHIRNLCPCRKLLRKFSYVQKLLSISQQQFDRCRSLHWLWYLTSIYYVKLRFDATHLTHVYYVNSRSNDVATLTSSPLTSGNIFATQIFPLAHENLLRTIFITLTLP